MSTFIELVSSVLEGGMLCSGRVANLVHYQLQCDSLTGAVVEFGCYQGRTAALMSFVAGKPVWVFDSFTGLPELSESDGKAKARLKAGDLAASERAVRDLFALRKLPAPHIQQGRFDQLAADQLPWYIAFAHIDCDLYTSTTEALAKVYPRMVPGAACVIDDYGWKDLPGVEAAAKEFFFNKPESVRSLNTGGPACHGVFIKGA